MRFENALMLTFTIWLVPILAVFLYFAYKGRRKLLEQFCSQAVFPKIIEGFSYKRRIVKYILLLVAFLFLLVALARPQWGYKVEEINRKGVDIYIALDVSKSMLADDMDPTRLERAKRELIDLMNVLQGDRIGLIAFAGSSFIQCPLTLDYNAMQMFMDQINTEMVPVKGTSIASAIKTALDAFNRSAESGSKAIILITDGEDHMGNVSGMAKEAQKQGVQIYCIGLGTSKGTIISENGIVKRDFFGNTVITRANFQQLKQIASTTGGLFINSVPGSDDIENVYLRGIKRKLKARDLKTIKQRTWIDRFQWPITVALLLILCEFLIREKQPAKRKKEQVAVKSVKSEVKK